MKRANREKPKIDTDLISRKNFLANDYLDKHT